jgi:hypothetical protein
MAGTFKLIGEISGASSSYSFTGISGYDQIYAVGSLKIASSSVSVGNVYCRINGDSGSNYRNASLRTATATGVSARTYTNYGSTLSYFHLNFFPGSNITEKPNMYGHFELMFANARYTDDSGKGYVGRSGHVYILESGTSANNNMSNYALNAGTWMSSAAITSIEFYQPEGNAFTSSSSITLYGLANS